MKFPKGAKVDLGLPVRELTEHGNDLEASISTWWEKTSASDFAEYYPKRTEYGSSDLQIMGDALELAYPPAPGFVVPWRNQELAITFYILGKVARALGAYLMGKVPSADTWHDITVYSMMARLGRAESEL